MSRHTVKHPRAAIGRRGVYPNGLPAAANDPADVLGKRGMLAVAPFAATLGIPIEGISKML